MRNPVSLANNVDSADEAHVSGIVVHTVADEAALVAERIDDMAGAEVVAREHGKLVVVLEASGERELADLVHRISLLPNVYSAALVSHFVDSPALEGDAL